MFIKSINIENFKCFEIEEISLGIPNGSSGSGLNIFIGENNCGKSTIFDSIRKTKETSIDLEEINNSAQSKKNEMKIIINSKDNKENICKSQYYHEEDPNYNLTKDNRFDIDFFHVNVNRIIIKKTGFNSLKSRYENGKDEDYENKRDNFQIIQEIANMKKEQKDIFCDIVNKFIPEIKRVFVDARRRPNIAQLKCKIFNGDIIDIRDMGSGIEQFIILLWIIKFGNKKIILIDEPEISLHPNAQILFSELLIESSKDKQILVATHSPYIFKDIIFSTGANLFIFKKINKGKIKIENTKENWGLFKWSPSWGEINYFAYKLPIIEFHNELYGYIEKEEPKKFELLKSNKTKKWYNERKKRENKVSLQEYIRHYIHHPENKKNKKYSESEFKKSIREMIKLLKVNKKC